MAAQDRTGSRSNDSARFRPHAGPDLAKPDKLQPSIVRLSPSQQALVAQWRRLALGAADRWATKYPWLREAYHDKAVDLLHQTALNFDPGLGVQFAAYLNESLRTGLMNVYRNQLPFGYRHTGPEEGMPSLTAYDSATMEPADDSPSETEEVEVVEVIGTILGRMDSSLAEILRKRHLERKSFEEIGRERGCTREWARRLYPRALEEARTITRQLGLAG